VREHRAIRQPEFVAGGLAQLLSGTLAQERDRVPVGRGHLLVPGHRPKGSVIALISGRRYCTSVLPDDDPRVMGGGSLLLPLTGW